MTVVSFVQRCEQKNTSFQMKLLDDVWGKKKNITAPPSLHVTMLTDPDFTQALSASHRHPVCGSCDRPEWLPSHLPTCNTQVVSSSALWAVSQISALIEV